MYGQLNNLNCIQLKNISIAYNSKTYSPPSKEKSVLIFNLYTNKINFTTYMSHFISVSEAEVDQTTP